MMKQNKGKAVVSSLLTILPIGFGIAVWDKLPDPMPMHWGVNGEVDGYGSRALAVLALPLVLLAFQWLCLFITSHDPKNKGQNAKAKDLVWWLMPYVSLFVNGLMYTAALGYTVNASTWGAVFMGLLFVIIGNYMPKCKQNHTIGIKIAWTLNDEENWNATHRLAGKVWVAGGLLILVCGFLPGNVGLIVMLAATLAMVLIPFIYSYRYYKNHQ